MCKAYHLQQTATATFVAQVRYHAAKAAYKERTQSWSTDEFHKSEEYIDSERKKIHTTKNLV